MVSLPVVVTVVFCRVLFKSAMTAAKESDLVKFCAEDVISPAGDGCTPCVGGTGLITGIVDPPIIDGSNNNPPDELAGFGGVVIFSDIGGFWAVSAGGI